MPQINLRVDEETARRLQYLSVRTGRSKTFYATEALTQYLDENEDHLLAKDALEEFTQSNDATWEDRRIHGTLQGGNN